MANVAVGILVYFSYCFIFAKHFMGLNDVYSKNFLHLILVAYWLLVLVALIGLFFAHEVDSRKPDRERLLNWEKACKKRSMMMKISNLICWLMYLGMAVIGEWRYFIPLVMSNLIMEMFRSRCSDLARKCRVRNGIPEPAEEEKKAASHKNVSRYNIIKET